jgi:hypothetical protein
MSQSERRKRNQAVQGGGVFIAYAHPEQIDAEFHGSLMDLIWADAVGKRRIVGHGGYIRMSSGPRIAATRNKLVKQFLGRPESAEWLWMVDADMTFTPDIVDRLLASADKNERPIVGGLCFAGGRGPFAYPTLYRFAKDIHGAPLCMRIEDYPRDALLRVDATGAACLLVHRSVFQAILANRPNTAFPWFAEAELPNPAGEAREIGEDITFCMRAAEAGFPVYVDTSIRVGHRKMFVLDEYEYDEIQADVANRGREAVDAEWLKRRGYA